MNNRHKKKFKKKGELQQLRDRCADIFVWQFIIAIGLVVLTFADMHLFSRFSDIMHKIHVYAFLSSSAIALIAFLIELRLHDATAHWVIWFKRVFFMFALGTGLIYLHTLLGKINYSWFVPIRKFMSLGSENMALRWMYGYIAIGLVVCFIIYLVNDYKIVSQKKKIKKVVLDAKKSNKK